VKVEEMPVGPEVRNEQQISCWVANMPVLDRSMFLRWAVWSHHAGQLGIQAWKMQLLANQAEQDGRAPDFTNLAGVEIALYHVRMGRMIDPDLAMREQDVQPGDVLVLIPAEGEMAQNIADAVRAQSFPTSIPSDAPFDRMTHQQLMQWKHEAAEREEDRAVMRQMKTTNITIGNHNTFTESPVVIADHIQSSFNTIADSSASDALKEILERLVLDVNEASKIASVEDAEAMGRDVKVLTEELTSRKPRRQWYEISVEGLRQAAVNIGEVGKPLLETLTKLAPIAAKLFAPA
jgi:hypothetical protein